MVQRNMPNTSPNGGPPTTWEPNRQAPPSPYVIPPLGKAVWRGLWNRCPVCGEGKVFNGFLRVVDECPNCGAPLGKIRADDAPPYFTIFIVGHLFLPPILMIEKHYEPSTLFYLAVGLPLFALMVTLMLRPIKGGTVGLMCRLGFDGTEHQ